MKRYTHDKRKCLSQVSVKTLKKEAMKSRRLLFRLRVLEHRTKEKGSGLLPTPIVMDTNCSTGTEKIDKRRERVKEKGINGNASE